MCSVSINPIQGVDADIRDPDNSSIFAQRCRFDHRAKVVRFSRQPCDEPSPELRQQTNSSSKHDRIDQFTVAQCLKQTLLPVAVFLIGYDTDTGLTRYSRRLRNLIRSHDEAIACPRQTFSFTMRFPYSSAPDAGAGPGD